MSRIVLLLVLMLFVAPVVTSASESENPRAMIGVTGGVATISGGSYFYFANQIQTFAPGFEVMVFHPSWFMVIGDFSTALNNKMEMRESGGSGFSMEGSAWYVDILAGARHQTDSGSLIYLAAGPTIAGGDSKTTFIESDGTSDQLKVEVGTSVGVAFGAGGALSVGDKLCVFLKFRHRLIIGEADLTQPGETDTATMDYDLGGIETAVGLGFFLR
jgi:opacity protein-like surface antigen